MKQVFQDPRNAEISVEDVPAPKLLAGCVLVRTVASLVSAGTERAASEFAGKNLLQKARMRPDLVRDVLHKICRDGLASAVSAVRSRLEQPSALGYSSAGSVIAVGEGVTDINPGDRVACAGAGHAVHAEFACVPRLLAARIPSEAVSFEEAAFTTIGAVALHGIRIAEVKLGDVVAVIGLGLLGQLTIQILRAAGCVALGMDLSPERVALASRMGADAVSSSATEFVDICLQHSAGHGVDCVLIAAQTSSNDPVNLAGAVARSRAVVVAVGAVGMEIPRRAFYEKELDFRISRSYGPGRYDSAYEQKGIDYPIGYVRWTETRNMEAFLRLISDRKLDLSSLITHRFPITEAGSAYDLINGKTHAPFLAVLLSYVAEAGQGQSRTMATLQPLSSDNGAEANRLESNKSIQLGFLGAGNFAMGTLLPALKKSRCIDMVVASAATGSHAWHAARKFGFRSCTTNDYEVLHDPTVNTVVIATRHHLHAEQVATAIVSGKHIFCEKPLCLNEQELRKIAVAHVQQNSAGKILMVGFNRRFAPFSIRVKKFFQDIGEPLVMNYRINAGFLPADHWLNDPQQGGGRIIGEVCHFVDLLCFFSGSPPVEVETRSLPNPGRYSNDNVVCSLRFANGSLGNITYAANGDKAYSKERIEIFGGGRVAALDDFRRLELVSEGKKQILRALLRQDKGHRGECEAFIEAITNSVDSPIPFRESVVSTLATFALEESRSVGKPVLVKDLISGDLIPDPQGERTSGFEQAS